MDCQKFTQEQLLISHSNTVYGIDICKQRNLLASGSCDKTAKLWSLEDNSLLKTYKYFGYVQEVVFSNQGNLLAFSGHGDYSVKLIDISDLKQDDIIFDFNGHKNQVRRLTFSNDSKYLISGSDDKTVRIWDVIQKIEVFYFNTESDVHGIAIRSDDTLIASNLYGGKILIWYFQNQTLLCSQQAHTRGAAIQFSYDQKLLISSGRESTIKLWHLEKLNNGQLILIKKIKTATAGNYIWTVLFSHCSRFIIAFSNRDSELRVIDTQIGDVIKLFKTKQTNNLYNHIINNSSVITAAKSKDMDIIAYGEDSNIVIWKMK